MTYKLGGHTPTSTSLTFRACCLAMPGIRKLGESRDLIITGGPLERAWQQGDTQTMQVWSANVRQGSTWP